MTTIPLLPACDEVDLEPLSTVKGILQPETMHQWLQPKGKR